MAMSDNLMDSELAGQMGATTIHDNDEPGPARVGTTYRPFEGPRNVTKAKDETAEKIRIEFESFLESFGSHSQVSTPGAYSQPAGPQYIRQLKSLQTNRLHTLYIDYEELDAHDTILAHAISEQYYRFQPYLRKAVQNLVRKYDPKYSYLNPNSHVEDDAQLRGGGGGESREFSVAFYNAPVKNGIREMKMDKLGCLTSIAGTVTRTSEVRPELVYGTFRCNDCKGITKDIEQQFKYTEPLMCQNPICGNRTNWELVIEQSKFTDWQKVRIQENPDEIPTGSMPRTMDVILRGDVVERAKAGDKALFTGMLIVVPDVSQLRSAGSSVQTERETQERNRGRDGFSNQGITGLKALGVSDLTYKLAFLGGSVRPLEENNVQPTSQEDGTAEEQRKKFLETLTAQEIDELRDMVSVEAQIYTKLVQSIAPAVYGHSTIKQGLLLQMMGGVHKVTPEGINLRGDINVCIVGDPSTSKSQFLKYVCGFLPRTVYTSGKASSAAGLTASVVKDEETGEFTIEAGALMLADNGICAIDEFDKMDLKDQVAIHEAMEQQTISIAKAGIQATLNARTSILAAANPIGGRYNKKLTLRQNVAMSPPIMSRFDLFFVVLDELNEQTDYQIARHIVNVHRLKDDAIQPEYSTAQIQRYIRYARTFRPKLTPPAMRLLVSQYRDLRQTDTAGNGKNSYRFTVRQLESMIRLSEAMARAHCTETITESFVEEAGKLLRTSVMTVEHDRIELEEDTEVAEGVQDLLDQGDSDFMEAFPPSTATRAGASDDASMAVDGQQQLTRSVAERLRRMDYDEFEEIKNLLVSFVQQSEDQGMHREDLIAKYFEHRQTDERFQNSSLEIEEQIIRKVIRRLVRKDQVFLPLTEGLVEGGASTMEPIDGADQLLVIHPSYDTQASV